MRSGDPSLGWVRLLVRLPAGSTRKDESRRLLRRAVDKRLGQEDPSGERWQLERLFGNAAPVELKRWWVVAGAVPTVPSYDISRVAYDLATRLAAERGLEVEPDLPSTAYGGEPGGAGRIGLVDEAADEHPALPCSVSKTWALDAVRARDAWELTPPAGGRSRGEGIRIGHIDTGYSDHPELERAALDLTTDYDVIDDDEDARDPLRRSFFSLLESPGHGTLTGSVIAGRAQGRIRGAAPLATLVPIRAIKSVVQVLDGDVARAVNRARERDCHIISMSLGGRGFIGLQDAIRAAVADGLIVMAAAGNKVTFVVAPASYPECLAVGATNCASVPWHDSSRGASVDISAPGESVWGAVVNTKVSPPTFGVGRTHGTSLSVAILAGIAALWLAHHGPEVIRQKYGRSNVQEAFLSLLRSDGRRVPSGWVANGWSRRFGVGIVDAVALLEAGLPDIPGLTDVDAPESTAKRESMVQTSLRPVARLQAALGELTADQVRAAVADLLGSTEDQVDTLPATAVSELVYRLGEDDQLRAALMSAAVPEALDAAADPAARTAARTLLARTSSVALLNRLKPR